MKQKLTARQKEIYDFIKSYMAKNSIPPSVAEINTAFGFKSPNAAFAHLGLIERKGWLVRIRGVDGKRVMRGIALT